MVLNCTLLKENTIICNGTEYTAGEGKLDWHDEWFWIYLGIYVGLVMFAGVMSGLTMGLLSLDLTSLKVLATGGKKDEQKHAKRIMPIVQKHHLLLVTLLLANAVAVESMPIFLDKICNTAIAIAVSVTAVLLVGEVLPQAVCTRYGLAIGATLSPLVYLLMVLLFVIAWPIAKILDCLLGKDHGTFFRRAELGALVDLHTATSEENEEPLTADEVLIIKGALSMRSKAVQDAYVSLDRVFMVEIKQKMDETMMKQIVSRGHSRVPVYDAQDDTIRGLLLVKNLIELDPEDALTVEQIFLQYGRPLPIVPHYMPLYDLLNDMQTGKCHMAAVTRNAGLVQPPGMTEVDGQIQVLDQKDIQGIITLEDIIEQLLQEDIVDETDVLVDVRKATRVARAKLARTHSEVGTKGPSQVRQYHRADSENSVINRGTLSRGPSLGNNGQATSINADIERGRTSDTEPLLQF